MKTLTTGKEESGFVKARMKPQEGAGAYKKSGFVKGPMIPQEGYAVERHHCL